MSSPAHAFHPHPYFSPPSGRTELTRSFDSFTITERIYEPALQLPRHSHGEAYFIFPLAGSFSDVFAGREELCYPGVVLFRPVDIPHSNVFHTNGARSLQVQMQPAMIQELSSAASLALDVSTLMAPEAVSLAGKLREVFWTEPLATSRLLLESMIVELLVEAHKKRPLAATGISPAALRVADLLRSDLNTTLDLQDMARLVDLHPVQLCREFKKTFRCTMGEFLQRCRVEKARELLSRSEQPLGDIAQQCGFYDQSHFTRSFRRLTGQNPLKYRKSGRS